MGDVLKHPKADEFTDEQAWNFKDGSTVTIKSGEGKPLTVQAAIYLLQDVQFRINKMMYRE